MNHEQEEFMSFFNLDKKDEHGRQTRIEHRGRYLRASRTGGVALRAQAKAAGANFTANTRRGFRVSATPVKSTQVAFQNGRFILRGRYGRGPTKLNLSKTGVTASTRNQLGTVNWVRPGRSSAKVAGVQFRGRKALVLQLLYLLAAAVGFFVHLLISALRLAAGMIASLARATPPALRSMRRALRNLRLRWTQRRFDADLLTALTTASASERRAMVWLIFLDWGRGQSVSRADSSTTSPSPADGTATTDDEWERARVLLRAVERQPPRGNWHLACLAAIANTFSQQLTSHERAELLLDIDEQLVAAGTRTVLQAQMIEVLADFAQLRLMAQPASRQTTATKLSAGDPDQATASSQTINFNTATLAQLQALPHIGPERAQAVIDLRPIQKLDQLRQIDGIGPARLQAIREHGVHV